MKEYKMVVLYIEYVIKSETGLFGRGTFCVELADTLVDKYVVDFKSKHRDCCIISVEMRDEE